MTLSPRQVPSSSQSPPPVLNNDTSRLNSADSELPSKSTSAESKSQKSEKQEDDQRSSRLSNGSANDANIQFVEVQTLLFGENPPALNPKTLFLKNHEPTKAS